MSAHSAAPGVAALFRAATLETAARNSAEIEAWRGVLPAGLRTFVPWLPTLPWHHLVTVSTRLREAGFVPVPHIAARRLADEAGARELLARLASEAAVDTVLLIGGDVDRPVGPYDSAASLLRSGLLQRHGIRRVGLAGYPEGHPRISASVLEAELTSKIELARSAALEPFVVSQFCFEADAILRWARALRAAHPGVPVRIGLAGPASVRTLLAYGARCGVGASLRAIRSQGISLTRLVSQVGPEDILARIAAAHESGDLDDAVEVHFFSFGGVEKTARWMAAMAAPQGGGALRAPIMGG